MKGLHSFKVLPVMTLMLLLLTMGVANPVFAAVIDEADTGGRPIEVFMTGAAERPNPGDPDGTGTAFFTLNQGQGEICFELTVENIDPATASHIHRASAEVAGPVVVPLIPPTTGSSSGCAVVDPGLIMEIRQFPERFYVNVHNPTYPAGAVRAQLSK
jgi:hypothetical protein